MPKLFDKPALILEDVYDRMIDDYLRTSKKEQKKWKYQLGTPDGSMVSVRHVEGLFIFQAKGIRYAVAGEESVQRNGFAWNHPGRQAFWEEVANNHTGNHTAKNHPVKVPTKPSEPVRG